MLSLMTCSCAVFEIYTYLSNIPLDMYARFVNSNCNIPARPGPSYATNPLSADYQTFNYNGRVWLHAMLYELPRYADK